jgi:Domain of unknown function (DUF5069)
MDLTKSYPRSVHDRIDGVVMIARTTDKAKAKANGNLGEYHYNCPMDQAVFGLLGIDHEAFLEKVKNAKNDGEIEAYVKGFVAKADPAAIERFNSAFVNTPPPAGSDSEKYFLELRNQVAPDRKDVTAWADLLDLDEKRPVPHRVAA